MVDAGFGTRILTTRLRTIGVAPASIEACVITHEHSDHMKGAAAAARRWGWKLFATNGTSAGIAAHDVPLTSFRAGDTLSFSRMDVQTAPTPHDASDPVGLVVTARGCGTRAAICYDIGHASAAVHAVCRDVDILILEANHDEGMLRAGPYPGWLRARIASDTGHLSNRAAGDLARESASARLAHLVLAHLSETNNTPETAWRAVSRAVKRTGFRGQLTTATQRGVVGPFSGRSAKPSSPLQYTLWPPTN